MIFITDEEYDNVSTMLDIDDSNQQEDPDPEFDIRYDWVFEALEHYRQYQATLEQ